MKQLLSVVHGLFGDFGVGAVCQQIAGVHPAATLAGRTRGWVVGFAKLDLGWGGVQVGWAWESRNPRKGAVVAPPFKGEGLRVPWVCFGGGPSASFVPASNDQSQAEMGVAECFGVARGGLPPPPNLSCAFDQQSAKRNSGNKFLGENRWELGQLVSLEPCPWGRHWVP